LAKAFQSAREKSDDSFSKLIDFELYAPSYYAPAAFMVSPIYYDKEKIGVLVVQIPINEIEDIMTSKRNWEEEGLGRTGESYLVGRDYKMRNNSRFLLEDPELYLALIKSLKVTENSLRLMKRHRTSIMLQAVRTQATEEISKGKQGTQIIDDYRGI